MNQLLSEQVWKRVIGMVLGLSAAIVAGVMLAGGVAWLSGDMGIAQAADPEPTAEKSDTGDGTYAPGEEFAYRLRFNFIGSLTSLPTHWNDQLDPLLEFTSNPLPPATAGLNCSISADTVLCTLPALTTSGTYDQFVNVRVREDAFTNPACGAFDNELRSGLTPGEGFLVEDVVSFIEPCAPRNVFRLCKEWEANGSINLPRAFNFNVEDDTGSAVFEIPGVVEGGPPACILLVAHGPVTVTELGIPGSWETPSWSLISSAANGGVGAEAEFFLSSNECFVPSAPLFASTEALEVVTGLDFKCTLTFTNVDDGAIVTVTTTPPPTVCARCNAATPPPATSTPVPPTNTPAPNTPVPPTATPTTSSGTQSPGLTDEQRTATAVAGAKTAAAQVTPIAPKTGDRASGGGNDSVVNMSLAIAGLLVLGAGLSVVAARRQR